MPLPGVCHQLQPRHTVTGHLLRVRPHIVPLHLGLLLGVVESIILEKYCSISFLSLPHIA